MKIKIYLIFIIIILPLKFINIIIYKLTNELVGKHLQFFNLVNWLRALSFILQPVNPSQWRTNDSTFFNLERLLPVCSKSSKVISKFFKFV